MSRRRRLQRPQPLATGAAVFALVLTGCGASSPSMTRLRSAAAQICGRALAQSARIRSPGVPSDTAAFLRRGIAVLGPELAGLRALRPPREQASGYSVALRAEQSELATLERTLHELSRGADPLSAIKTLQHRLGPLEADDAAAWRALDIPACVSH